MRNILICLYFISTNTISFSAVDTVYLSLSDSNFYEKYSISAGQSGIKINYAQQPMFDFKDEMMVTDAYYILRRKERKKWWESQKYINLAEGKFISGKRFGIFKFYIWEDKLKKKNGKEEKIIFTQSCIFINSRLEYENIFYENSKVIHQLIYVNDTLNGLAIFTINDEFRYTIYKHGKIYSSRDYLNGRLREYYLHEDTSFSQKSIFYRDNYDEIVEIYKKNDKVTKVVVINSNPNNIYRIEYLGSFISPTLASEYSLVSEPLNIVLANGVITNFFIDGSIVYKKVPAE